MCTLTSSKNFTPVQPSTSEISSSLVASLGCPPASKLTSYGRATREHLAITIQQGLSGPVALVLEFSFSRSRFQSLWFASL